MGNLSDERAPRRAVIARRLGLSLRFSLFVLTVLVITSVIVFGISAFLDLPRPGERLGIGDLVATILAACIITGTLVSMPLGNLSLKPIRDLAAGIDLLAQGRFDTRLDLKRPHEFQGLSESFNHLASELQSVEILRADFVNDFSHEFKTPIASIKGFASQLLRDDLTDDERAEYLRIIIDESDRLAKLSSGILELSKLESQTMPPSRKAFDLSEQIRRCILLLEDRWEEKGISLDVELADCRISGNEDMLAQAWMNLLENAIKFTPAGGRIDIRLEESAGVVSVILHDNGIGIDARTAEHAFDRFFQGDPSHSTEGNGIGLSLTRRIIELHGGSIKLEGSPAKGTTALATLPKSSELPDRSPEEARSRNRSERDQRIPAS